LVTLEDIRRAAQRLRGVIHETPLDYSNTFSQMTGSHVLLKLENLQRTGSFKVRGAYNKVASLSRRQRERGVIAASAGNHAQGLALAAREAGVPCTIVMPQEASMAKVAATRGYGATVLLHGSNYDEAAEHAASLAKEEGMTLVHGFDDDLVIAGQGTIGLELLEQEPELDAVVAPVGGGGLISGIAVALKESRPSVQVIGVQVKAAEAALVSLARGRRVRVAPRATIADGIAIARLGRRPFALMRRYVDQVVTVEEEEVAHAMMLLTERAKLLVEGAGAVGLAALLGAKVALPKKKVAIVLSGGNIDLTLVSQVIHHGLAHAGRYLVVKATIRDRPGRLAALLDCLARARTSVLEVRHRREGLFLDWDRVEVEVTVETRDREHRQEVAQALAEGGFLLAPSASAPPSEATLEVMARELVE